MWHVWMLGLLVACNSGGTGDDFPVLPGGPSGPGTIVDATPPDMPPVEAGTTIDGRVCVLTDMRRFTTCLESGAGGITVRLGTKTAITALDGAFSIDRPSDSQLVWRASGDNIVSSVFAFGPTTSIPAVDLQTFNDILGANSVVLQNNQGSIVTRLVRNGLPVVGATVTDAPLAQFATKYDGPTVTAWTELKTGNQGVAWIAGAQVGDNTVTVSPMTGTGASTKLPVEDGAITFATIDLP
jgi:hypothetical protein